MRALVAVAFALLGVTAFYSTATVRGDTLFSDDFSSGSTANWKQYDGKFSIVNGAYQLQSTAFLNDARTVAGKTSWTDYSVDLDYNIVDQGHTDPLSGPSDWPANVLFRVADIASGINKGHYYQLTIGPTRYEINYIYGSVDKIETLGTATFSGFPVHSWHHLTLNVVGETASAYVDGKKVLTTSLVSQDVNAPRGPAAGAIGLKAIDGSTVQFDNIRVSSVSEVTPKAQSTRPPSLDDVTQKLLDEAIAKLRGPQAKQVASLKQKYKHESDASAAQRTVLCNEMQREVLRVMVVTDNKVSEASPTDKERLTKIDEALKIAGKETDSTLAKAQCKKQILAAVDENNLWDEETRYSQFEIISAAPTEKRKSLLAIYNKYRPKFDVLYQRESAQAEQYKRDLLKIIAPNAGDDKK